MSEIEIYRYEQMSVTDEEFYRAETDDRLDLVDRSSWYGVLDEEGEVLTAAHASAFS